MTKADLVDTIFEKVGSSKLESQSIVEILFDTIKQTLIDGESVKVSGFGTFNVRKKNARRGRNPKTGDELEITPRRVISFYSNKRFLTRLRTANSLKTKRGGN